MIGRRSTRFFATILRQAQLEHGTTLFVKQGDITAEAVDVIVNNANSYLIHDDGLALDIVTKGGPKIQEESNLIIKRFGNPIPTGNVVSTSGGDLPCKKVYHAVGPIYTKKGFECPLQLKRTIENSLKVATLMKMNSIAMPALCTGLY